MKYLVVILSTCWPVAVLSPSSPHSSCGFKDNNSQFAYLGIPWLDLAQQQKMEIGQLQSEGIQGENFVVTLL